MTRATRLLTILSLTLFAHQADAAGKPPAVGDAAKDFTLKTIGGQAVQLSKLNAEGPVVLVVLRGYPGYQCPLCTRQVGEFIGKAKELKAAGAKVLFVYPGPSDNLQERANEFFTGKDPGEFIYTLDPDYKFTREYNLRWQEPRETAYPATFVIDAKGKVVYQKVSKTHAGRASVQDVLGALGAK